MINNSLQKIYLTLLFTLLSCLSLIYDSYTKKAKAASFEFEFIENNSQEVKGEGYLRFSDRYVSQEFIDSGGNGGYRLNQSKFGSERALLGNSVRFNFLFSVAHPDWPSVVFEDIVEDFYYGPWFDFTDGHLSEIRFSQLQIRDGIYYYYFEVGNSAHCLPPQNYNNILNLSPLTRITCYQLSIYVPPLFPDSETYLIPGTNRDGILVERISGRVERKYNNYRPWDYKTNQFIWMGNNGYSALVEYSYFNDNFSSIVTEKGDGITSNIYSLKFDLFEPSSELATQSIQVISDGISNYRELPTLAYRQSVGFWDPRRTSRTCFVVLSVFDFVIFPLRRFIVGNSPSPTLFKLIAEFISRSTFIFSIRSSYSLMEQSVNTNSSR